MAVIEPQTEGSSTRPARKTRAKVVLALPKGLVDPGEKPEQTALREVREETGLTATSITKLARHQVRLRAFLGRRATGIQDRFVLPVALSVGRD